MLLFTQHDILITMNGPEYQKGFTYVELLIVIAIMGIIASIAMVRTDLMQADSEIRGGAQQIINIAKRARQQSISVEQYFSIFPSYGLYMDTNSPHEVTIYANCLPDDNEDGQVDHEDNFAYNGDAHDTCADEIGSHPDLTDGDEATVDRVTLQNNVRIHSIEAHTKDGTTIDLESVSVNYLRPEPTVWIVPVDQTGTELSPLSSGYVVVSIRDRADTYQKDISFYTSALVEAERVDVQ